MVENLGQKICIFMVDGKVTGPRTAEIENWTGKAIYHPRQKIENIFSREELSRSGVYILKSIPENDDYTERVYIGQSDDLLGRLKEHISNDKDEFTEFLAFISKDHLLTPSQTLYLESRLITLTKEAKKAHITNIQSPNLPRLSEADKAVMEYFLLQMMLVLPLMDFKFLIRTTTTGKQVDKENRVVFEINKDVKARMIESDEGYVVLKGSYSKKELSNSISPGWVKLRDSLINKGSLTAKESYYEFNEDVIFSSPSAAAAVILGRQIAGPLEWKETKTKKTYKEYKESTS